MPAADAAAYERLERFRWGGPPDRCPHCGTPGRCSFLRPPAEGRRTRTGAVTGRRVWKCGACRRQFSVLTGTVLAGSRLPVPTLIAVLEDWERSGRPTATELADRHELTPEAARQLIRRVDAALRGRHLPPLPAIFAVPPSEAAGLRWRTPARIRPRRQAGPTADYGA